MKLYTRTGDDGTTGLFGGQRVPKDHPRVAAYGDIDELNAALGMAISALAQAGPAVRERFAAILTQLQSRLFDIGADPRSASVAPRTSPLGRNDPCRCGSGKKYKSCHLDEDRLLK